MKEKLFNFLPYIIILILNFYALPNFASNTAMAAIIMLFVIPFIVFLSAIIHGLYNNFSFVFPIITMILFTPSIFIYYNPSAFVYIIIYGIIAIIGSGIGSIFYKN